MNPGERLARHFHPKLLTVFAEGYRLSDLRADSVAGLTVAIVALPLAMALAVASGADPATGLLTAIVAGFLISALGGSRVQVGGPTGAFIPVIYAIIATHGYDGLVIATLMAGVILVVAGLLKVGMNASSTTPDQFAQYIRDEIAKWTKVAKAANIKLE